MIGVRRLKRVWAVGLAVGLLAACWWVPWEARLTRHAAAVESSWLIDLGTAPVWSPPAAPTYRQFFDHFHPYDRKDDAASQRLPEVQPADAAITVSPHWLDWSLTLALGLWVPSVVVACSTRCPPSGAAARSMSRPGWRPAGWSRP